MVREYVKQWSVPSKREGQPPHKVSLRRGGGYGCDCWPWKKTRKNCDHIEEVIHNPDLYSGAELPKLRIIPDNVSEAKRIGNEFIIPLIPLGRAETLPLLATICYDLMREGASWFQVREYYRDMIPKDWTRDSVTEYIEMHGRHVQTQDSLHSKHGEIPQFETTVTFERVERKKADGTTRTLLEFGGVNER